LRIADDSFCAAFEMTLTTSNAAFFTLAHAAFAAIDASEALHFAEHHATSSWPSNAAPMMDQKEFVGLMQES
jgi:hypothetical protein